MRYDAFKTTPTPRMARESGFLPRLNNGCAAKTATVRSRLKRYAKRLESNPAFCVPDCANGATNSSPATRRAGWRGARRSSAAAGLALQPGAASAFRKPVDAGRTAPGCQIFRQIDAAALAFAIGRRCFVSASRTVRIDGAGWQFLNAPSRRWRRRIGSRVAVDNHQIDPATGFGPELAEAGVVKEITAGGRIDFPAFTQVAAESIDNHHGSAQIKCDRRGRLERSHDYDGVGRRNRFRHAACERRDGTVRLHYFKSAMDRPIGNDRQRQHTRECDAFVCAPHGD